MTEQVIRIATRKSPLALWQAEFVAGELRRFHPGVRIELIKMSTQGDKILDSPLAKIGGKGLFVKELERSLLDGKADIAVHSMKDVPVEFPEGLYLPVICEREDPRDAFVSIRFKSWRDLPAGACVGTSSLRRQAQLRRLRPDLVIRDLRGNVGSRLEKLDRGDYDAILLAAAGLLRLNLAARITEYLEPEVMLPAIGQGAVGIECRSNDAVILSFIQPLNHALTHTRVVAERAMNHRLEGGCQVPIAGHATITGTQLTLHGLVGRPDGSHTVASSTRGAMENAEQLGIALADELFDLGARNILKDVYHQS